MRALLPWTWHIKSLDTTTFTVILSKLSVVYRYKGDFERSVQFALKAKKIADEQCGTKSHPGMLLLILIVFSTMLSFCY